MRELSIYAVVVVVGCVIGCGTDRTPSALPPAPTPLSLAEWRRLPVGEKYDEATFDRLKLNDPALKRDQVWHRFMVETVIPERQVDLPDDLPAPNGRAGRQG